MGALYKKARRANRISLNDQDKRDFFYETVCDFTQKDWQFFFKAWGINLSNISLNKMAARYPLMTQEIWKYNPLTKTGGDTQIDLYNRSFWTATANSWSTQEGSNGFIANAFDGSLTTYWHTNYGGGTGPTSPPFTITVNMGRNLPVKGFSVALRQSGSGVATAVKNIMVEVSDDNITWTAINTLFIPTSTPAVPQTRAGFISLNLSQGLQNFELPAPLSFRYFRFTIPTAADNNNNSANSALSEINVIKP
jgi:hypothetical protein